MGEPSELVESRPSDESNTPFSAEEKTYILSGLNEIKQYLLTAHQLDPEIVEGRLKYLEDALPRLGRIDWKGVLVNTVIQIVVQAAVTPQATRDIIQFVGHALRQILHITPLLLP
jgi:hypothetical protein